MRTTRRRDFQEALSDVASMSLEWSLRWESESSNAISSQYHWYHTTHTRVCKLNSGACRGDF